LNGFSSLPDILWHPETRKFIEADPALKQEFKRATSSRRARKANEGFFLIAALILSGNTRHRIGRLGEVLPGGKQKAQTLLAEYALSTRARLTERYLFPQINRNPAILGTLAPPHPTKTD